MGILLKQIRIHGFRGLDQPILFPKQYALGRADTLTLGVLTCIGTITLTAK